MQLIEKAIKTQYLNFLKVIHNRLHKKVDLRWCFNEEQPDFIPDYLIISRCGRTNKEQALNNLTAKIMPYFWSRYMWQMVHKSVFQAINNKYLKTMYVAEQPKYSFKDLSKVFFLKPCARNLIRILHYCEKQLLQKFFILLR
jgi:hypothetical protein